MTNAEIDKRLADLEEALRSLGDAIDGLTKQIDELMPSARKAAALLDASPLAKMRGILANARVQRH